MSAHDWEAVIFLGILGAVAGLAFAGLLIACAS